MREFMSERIAGEIAQLRYQLRQSQIAKVKAASVVKVLKRHSDMDACKGCGYQKCSCPPEPVEEAGPVWKQVMEGRADLVMPFADGSGTVVGRVEYFPNARQYKALHCGAANWVWRTNVSEARAWVEEQHAAQAEPVEVKAAGEWVASTNIPKLTFYWMYGRALGRIRNNTALIYGTGGLDGEKDFDTAAEARAWVEEMCST